MLLVAVGAIAVTLAAALTPVIAGKVTFATWPTVTEAMSASAMFAVTVMAETSAIVTKPEELPDDEDEPVDDDPEPDAPAPDDPDPEPDEPDDPDAPDEPPTVPFTATTSPAIGAVRVVAERFDLAVASASRAEFTWACADRMADRALLTDCVLLPDWPPPEKLCVLAATAAARFDRA